MAKVKVAVANTIGKVISFDPNATVGAQIGTDLKLPDGSVPSLRELAAAIVVAAGDLTFADISGIGAIIDESQIADGDILARVADDETITGDWTFSGNILIGTDWNFLDDIGIQFGNSADGRIYYSSSGEVRIDTILGAGFAVRTNGNEYQIQVIDGGKVDLSFNGASKFATTLTGVIITGDITATTFGGITEANLLDKSADETITGDWTFSGDILVGTDWNFVDDVGIQFGNSADGRIYYSSSGEVRIDTILGAGFAVRTNGNEYQIQVVDGGKVDLSWNGGTRIETTSPGAKVTGILEVTADVLAESGLSVQGTATDQGQVGQIAFVDVNGAVGRFGSYNWDTASYQPVELRGSTIAVTGPATFLNITNFTDVVRINATGDAGLGTTTHGFQVGLTASTNIIMDNNELMSRNNGGVSTLFINNDGGTVNIGNAATAALVVSGAITGLSFGGITSANLLDKTANESISGQYFFTATLTVNDAANSSSTLIVGESATLRGDSADGRLILYGEQTSVIRSYQLSNSGSNLQETLAAGLNRQVFGGANYIHNMFDGVNFRLYGPSDSNFVTLHHDDTNFNITTSGTNEIRVGETGTLVHLLSVTDVSLVSTNHPFQIGLTSGNNVRIDNNEIMAVSNGSAATLNLNIEGGNVHVGASGTRVAMIAGAITALSFGGILSANLLDKSADETITGRYSFTDVNGTGVTSSASVDDHAGSPRDVGFNVLPVFNSDTSDTLEANHCGKMNIKTNTTGRTLTAEASSSTDFPVGGVTHMLNWGTSANYSFTEGTGTTIWIVTPGTGAVDSAGGFSLQPGGFCTIWRFSATAYYCWGAELN